MCTFSCISYVCSCITYIPYAFSKNLSVVLLKADLDICKHRIYTASGEERGGILVILDVQLGDKNVCAADFDVPW